MSVTAAAARLARLHALPRAAPQSATRGLCGLPFRIRAPLQRLMEKKTIQDQAPTAGMGGLGDGEKLETSDSGPDYVRLALTSRVYDMIAETPLQYSDGLSARLGANVHLKREDLLPSFSFKLRGAYNQLAVNNPMGVVTWSVGSQGHSVAVAARALGIPVTVVMPERAPLKRRLAIERAGARVVIAGKTLADSEAHAEELVATDERLTLVQPHDDPQVIAGQATAALEVIKQIGPALEITEGGSGRLDAIFVVAGGSSLLAGIAAVMKAVMPGTKVIGVEAESADLLHRSLLSGHRLSVPEPAHFVDGASVRQLGPEVFRLCNELVDDIVVVNDDEICAAVRDAFEDTRAVLEPAGAVAIAGLKKYVDAMPTLAGTASKGNFVAVSSDASNIEFDILRFIAERSTIGDSREKLFAMRMPDRTGMFFDMYKAVQPHHVTEFVYRHSPVHDDALVYMSIEQAENVAGDFSDEVMTNLQPLGVHVRDITADEMGKSHAKNLAGGRPGAIKGERTIRIEFPESGSGALYEFLSSLRKDWYLTMLHYRNQGGQVGKVLAGVRVPDGEDAAFDRLLDSLGCTYYDETNNPIYLEFMR